MSVVCLSVTIPKSGIHEVIYHFHSFQVFHELMHGALPHLWCWTDAKCHPVPPISPKWCIERGFVTRLSIKMFLPETIFGVYKGELLFLSQLPPLSAVGSAFDGWRHSNREGQGIYATCWVWQRLIYWRPTRLVQLLGWWCHCLPSHPVSLWSGFLIFVLFSAKLHRKIFEGLFTCDP